MSSFAVGDRVRVRGPHGRGFRYMVIDKEAGECEEHQCKKWSIKLWNDSTPAIFCESILEPELGEQK